MSEGTVRFEENILSSGVIYFGTERIGLIGRRRERIFSNLAGSILDISTNFESMEISGV